MIERNFVKIEKDIYAFYRGNAHVATVRSEDITAEQVEHYRRYPEQLLEIEIDKKA